MPSTSGAKHFGRPSLMPTVGYYVAEGTREAELTTLLEDRDEYTAENVFWVPTRARWSHIQKQATQPTIGKTFDEAMDAIERENPTLKGVLPKIFALPVPPQGSWTVV